MRDVQRGEACLTTYQQVFLYTYSKVKTIY